MELTASGDTQQLADQYLLLKSGRMYDLRLVLNADELKLTCRVAPKKSTANIGQQKARMKPYKRDLRATGPVTVARSGGMPAPTIIFDGEDREVVWADAPSQSAFNIGSKRTHSMTAQGHDDYGDNDDDAVQLEAVVIESAESSIVPRQSEEEVQQHAQAEASVSNSNSSNEGASEVARQTQTWSTLGS